MKALIVIHRYVGVVLGVIMTLWCASGFVMMYQGYPETTLAERRAGLAPLDLTQCCANVPLPDDASANGLRIEMLNGAPVIRMPGPDGGLAFDARSGQTIGVLDEAGVRSVANEFAKGNGIAGEIAKLEQIRADQWVVSGARQQPLWRAAFDDPGATLVYVNATSGQVVQDANAHERVWNWLGAIPHWLYPQILRENQQLWSQAVIWLSAIGCFLVITGMVIGFIRLRGKSGRWWPYRNRPMWMWHHVFGTFAGVLVLTWTFSGLLTMQPWGLFEKEPPVARSDISGSMTWGGARAVIERAAQEPSLAGAVAMRAAPFMGRPYLVATMPDGSEVRVGAEGFAPLNEQEIVSGLTASGGLLAVGKLDLLTEEDDYHYGHKREVALPVWRVTLSDPDETRVYINATTGDARIVGATAKSYRWLESGLHSLDFSFLRARPLWDVVTLVLMALVTIACATGAWMSFTRIGQDVSRLRAFFQRRKSGPMA
ncbi:MAG: PepSY domain-containing protein [Hyphomonadaceae bacterium]